MSQNDPGVQKTSPFTSFRYKEGSAVRLIPLHGCYCESSDAPSRVLPRHLGGFADNMRRQALELMTMAQRYSLSSFASDSVIRCITTLPKNRLSLDFVPHNVV